MFRRTSKHPEIFVRLDVRLNVLEFSNVYTYFLGRLDVNPKKFLIYTGCAEDDDDDENDEYDGLDCMDCIRNDNVDGDGDEGFVGRLRKNGQGFTRCGCNKACQTNACKCIKSYMVCNSRCHGRSSNPKCLND